MHLKKYGNLYAGIMFLAFTIVFAVQFPAIRITRIALVNSAAYPRVILAMLGVLSCAQIWFSIRELKRTKIEGSEAVGGKEVKKKDYACVLRTLILSCLYVLLLEPLGFLISSIIYVFFQILNLCPKEELNIAKFAVIAVVSSLIIYVMFRNGLNLMLPAGPLAGLF